MVASLIASGVSAAVIGAATWVFVSRSWRMRAHAVVDTDSQFLSQLSLVFAEIEFALEDRRLVEEARARVRRAHRPRWP